MAKKGHNVTVITSDSNIFSDIPYKLKERLKIETYDQLFIYWLKTIKYKVSKSFLRIISWFHFELNLLFLNKKVKKTGCDYCF
ncbi:hypothetical protein ARAF_1622 [Arsenophonus endosymbiont of Aleurodicus floccissimus]|nr:hypothetical protein ARAF_1622 [Arsenophonus endosymbiont of Aleurodicus floccissimus]